MAKTSGKKNDSTSESNDETLITNYKIGCHQEIDLFFLRLTDAGGNRSLSIKIGDMDAQVLGLELPGQQSPILTLYHIIIAILDVQKVTVKKVVIYDHKEGRLISKLYLADEYEKNTVV
jgi:bifunctional DNase/RNase